MPDCTTRPTEIQPDRDTSNLVSIQYDNPDTIYESRAHTCRGQNCPTCARLTGYRLAYGLQRALSDCDRLTIATLTIDPRLFNGPYAAYLALKHNSPWETVWRYLQRHDYLATSRFVRVLEFTKQRWPHLHWLLDTARYIPPEAIQDRWPWGFVDLRSIPRATAIGYITKSFFTTPNYPAELLASREIVRRFNVSRGLIPREVGEKAAQARKPRTVRPPSTKPRRTVAERCEDCRQSAHSDLVELGEDGFPVRRISGLDLPIDLQAALLSKPLGPNQGKLQLSEREAAYLRAMDLLGLSRHIDRHYDPDDDHDRVQRDIEDLQAIREIQLRFHAQKSLPNIPDSLSCK